VSFFSCSFSFLAGAFAAGSAFTAAGVFGAAEATLAGLFSAGFLLPAALPYALGGDGNGKPSSSRPTGEPGISFRL